MDSENESEVGDLSYSVLLNSDMDLTNGEINNYSNGGVERMVSNYQELQGEDDRVVPTRRTLTTKCRKCRGIGHNTRKCKSDHYQLDNETPLTDFVRLRKMPRRGQADQGI